MATKNKRKWKVYTQIMKRFGLFNKETGNPEQDIISISGGRISINILSARHNLHGELLCKLDGYFLHSGALLRVSG
jgi:hypothetical protein